MVLAEAMLAVAETKKEMMIATKSRQRLLRLWLAMTGGDCLVRLAMTPTPSLRGAAGDEAIPEIATRHATLAAKG